MIIDEFYKAHDMALVLKLLGQEPTITAVSFKQIQFWGGFSYVVDSWYSRLGGEEFHRVFRWGPGHRWTNHRPPTVVDSRGIDTRDIRWWDAYETARRGIYLYHYAFVFPQQVKDKSAFYASASWARGEGEQARRWAEKTYGSLKRPLRMHSVYQFFGWLERYAGSHPAEIEALRDDITKGIIEIDVRRTDDIERLLSSRWYSLAKSVVKSVGPQRRVRTFGRHWKFIAYKALANPRIVPSLVSSIGKRIWNRMILRK